MNDEELGSAWTTLDPTWAERRRIDGRVRAWLEAHDTSLAAEWLGMFQVAPVTSFALVTVSALAVAVAPPVLWLARALL
jgi:hypothetical protein